MRLVWFLAPILVYHALVGFGYLQCLSSSGSGYVCKALLWWHGSPLDLVALASCYVLAIAGLVRLCWGLSR